MSKGKKEISTEELVVKLLVEIASKLDSSASQIPIRGLHANGKLGQLPGVVDDTIIQGDVYQPDRQSVKLFYHENSGDVWVYENGNLETIIPSGGIGNLMIEPGFVYAEPGLKEENPVESEETPVEYAQTAEELAQSVLDGAA